MIRRVGERLVKGQRYGVRHGAYAILPRGKDVLLTYSGYPDGELQLPGGGLDPGESPLTALYREVREETGWTIAAPRRMGAFRRFVFMPDYDKWAEKICTVYIARPVRCLGDPEEADHTANWVPIRLAADILGNEGDRMFLSRLL